MSHWQLLNLTPDADERSIKRAYARLLKNHRPDENPDEFQRLREAYETSLAEARWRAQIEDEVVDAPLAIIAPTAEYSPLVSPLESVDTLITLSPPERSLEQMQQWLAEGKGRQVMDALRHWLASDWLLPFERRQQFEESILDWLESASQWSPSFFDDVCQAMGWDEAQGNLPCEYWRWDRLIRRCEMQVMEESVRRDLARFDADNIHGQAAALLFKPMSDSRRRGLADYLTSLDWQRFTQIAQSIEYQYPELPQRLGLKTLDNWRDWLPPESFRGVYLFLWLALAVIVMPSVFAETAKRDGLAGLLVIPLFIPLVIWLGMKAYQIWSLVAVSAGSLDVLLSRRLLPRRWYRQGAGLLLLRHVLPTAVPAALAYAWASHVPWIRWVSPLVVFLGTLYFTNMALRGGKVSMWTAALRAIRHKVGQLLLRVLQREVFVVLIIMLVMGVSTYSRMKPGF